MLTRRQRIHFLGLARTGAELLAAAAILGRANGLRGFNGERLGFNLFLGRALDDPRWWQRTWRLLGEGLDMDAAKARAALEERAEADRRRDPRAALAPVPSAAVLELRHPTMTATAPKRVAATAGAIASARPRTASESTAKRATATAAPSTTRRAAA